MTSFILPFRDLQYTICYYWSKKSDIDASHNCSAKTGFIRVVLIASVPLLLRMMQNLRIA